jgi:hypothetical protein
MDVRIAIVSLGTLLSFVAYALYFRDLRNHAIKPHAFSWLLWSVLGGIAFAAQITQGGGLGSAISFMDAVFCLAIFVIALSRADIAYVLFDWVALTLASLSLVLWWSTRTPTYSVILITFIDVLAFFPTCRKSFMHPREESLTIFLISSLKYVAAALSMASFSISTIFYPSVLAVVNAMFVLFLLMRRQMLPRSQS